MFKVITGTLQANHISMQLTDDTINDDSIFEVYTDTENVIPSSVSVGGHTVTITFDSKPTSNVGIKVLVNNIVGEFAPDLDHIDANNVYYENPFTGEQPIGSHFADLELNYDGYALPLLNNIDDELHTDTVLDGVLYHSSAGNIWKKLDASNIDYDADSTIYSAMGDIDALETDSKNLVGAINEVKESSGGGIGYIDSSKVIYRSGNDPVSNLSPYTATENCWAMTYCCSTSSGAYAQIYLNGVIVLGTSGSQYIIQTIPLKQGDTITFRTGNSFKYILVIYGMKG